MPDSQDFDRQKQIAILKDLRQKELLSEADYQVLLKTSGAAPEAVFDHRGQSVGTQICIANVNQVAPEPGASPETLRRAYLHRVFQQSCRLPLSGVDPKAAADDGCRELQLAAVYTALMTQRPEEDTGRSGESARRGMEGQPRRLSALEVLDREQYLALLGDPGGGKSTFVNFLAICMAGEALVDQSANLNALTSPLPREEPESRRKETEQQSWKHGALLPIKIVLRDLVARGLPDPGGRASPDTLWKFIEAELGDDLREYAPHLKKELLEKGGLILLDGLDEVPDANQRRAQIKHAVNGFRDVFQSCRILATSRTYAYQKQEWKLEGFAEAVLSAFTSSQSKRFVERWYAHLAAVRGLDARDAQGKAEILKSAIKRSPRLAELAARPLLLTLMASLHAWRGGSLPEKREELYADAVELLLDQWERLKVVIDTTGNPVVRDESLAEYLKVDRAVIREALNLLAFEAHRYQPELKGTADISQERLVGALIEYSGNPDVKPVRLVEYIQKRAGLLAARGEGVYTFPHRTFQEYLAACYLTDYNFPDEAVSFFRKDPQRWREALLLAGAKAARGSTSAVWNLAEALCYREPPTQEDASRAEGDCWCALVAAQALMENERERLKKVPEWNAAKLERVRRWLLFIVTQGFLPAGDRALAGECLSVFGDDRDFEELAIVPAGPFTMGNNEDKRPKPQHQVMLPGYKIGRYPVTNLQYRRFVEATGHKWSSTDGLRVERSNCPATGVSWNDAIAFCEWLTDEWRKQNKISANETVRLPSEAEWEKAARGTDGREYPWGNAWGWSKCNTNESGLGKTSAVGMFPADVSPYGCMDMAGNVWEWTGSLWGKDRGEPEFKYPYRPDDGRENLEAGGESLRVLRGGSWDDSHHFARCSYRFRDDPDFRSDGFGFRVVVSPVSRPSAP